MSGQLNSRDGLVVRAWNGTPIGRRTTDGYVNATAMCKANGKRWSDYRESDRCQRYLDALSELTGIPVVSLYHSVEGRSGGTFVHPQVAVDLARWISAPFAVWMDGWFIEESKKRIGRSPARIKGVKARNRLTDVMFEHDVDGFGMACITNITYQCGWGQTADGLRNTMNLAPRASIRDHMQDKDLNRLLVHETVLSVQCEMQNTRGNEANMILASNCGHAVEQMLTKPILSDADTGALPRRQSASPYEPFLPEVDF